MDALFAERDQWDWVEFLCESGLPVAPVQDYGQVVSDPQVLANNYIVPFRHPDGRRNADRWAGGTAFASPGQVRHGAPEFGEHTEEVLLAAGYSWEELAALRDAGAIGGR